MIHIHQTHDHELLASLNREVQERHHFLYPEVFKPYDKDAVLPFYKEALNNSGYAFIAYFDNKPVGIFCSLLKSCRKTHFSMRSIFYL